MRTTPHLLAAVFAIATLHAAPVGKTKPAPAAQVVEKAPEGFPLTLRGIFGKGDKAEISVQDKISGKSVWLSPGETRSGWKFESAEAATGRAVFSQGARRVILFQAGEVREPTIPRLKSVMDSPVFRKFRELMQNPEYAKLYGEVSDEALVTVRKNHPEYFNSTRTEEEHPDDVIVDIAREEKRILLSKTGPAAEALSAVVIPITDATLRMIPPDSTRKGAGSAAGGEGDSGDDPKTLRLYEAADALYRERTGEK